MKKVLLLGDSIRMGYAPAVKDLLDGEFDVYYSDDNGRFAAYTLWQVNQMFKTYGKFDIVHWNNGYWDMNIEHPMTAAIHPIDEYIHFLKRIIAEIRNNGATVIFATTTPVLASGDSTDNSGTGSKINYNNKSIVEYNTAASKLMESEGIIINDLYELCKQDSNCYKCEDLLHLNEEGNQACATQVAEFIRNAAK